MTTPSIPPPDHLGFRRNLEKVLLVSCNITRDPYPVYPLGMAVVAGALAREGYQVDQFDFLAEGRREDALRERMRAFAPHCVCFSIRNLDNCDSLTAVSYPATAKRLVEVVREEAQVPVILGGPAFSILPEDLLAFTGADHGIVGEGDRMICRLLRALAEGRQPPKVLRDTEYLGGEAMASPLFAPSLARFYQAESGMLNVQVKRGCPHGCVYCSYPALEGRRYRFRDPEAVADDMERAWKDLGVDQFFITDSVFNDGAGHYLRVAEELIRRALPVRWSCYLRPQGIGRREIGLLKRAGLYAAELGTDAACDETLDALGKGFTFAEALEVNRAMVAERVPCAHFVMFGGPGETPETVARGLANLDLLEHTVVFAFTGIRILPGTPMVDLAIRDGLLAPGAPLREPVFYQSPGIPAELMNRMIAAAFGRRRDRFFPPSRSQERHEALRRYGFRGLLWDTLIRFPQQSEAAQC